MKTNELDTLLGRYYEGLTTRDEELRLRQVLTANDSPRYDADRAVLGLIEAKRKLAAPAQRRVRTFSRAAAAVAAIFCLSVAAATITYHVVVEDDASPSSPSSTISKSSNPSKETAPENEATLADTLVFKNQSLAEIARQITSAFGCKVELTDSVTADLRLYLTLPKGSTVGYFVETIDAYDALEATMEEDVITIKRQEEQQ